jgi:hypothetical protein
MLWQLKPAAGGGGGVTDHGALTGLADDDHPQYLNNTRGDTRYYTKSEVDALIAAAGGGLSDGDFDEVIVSGGATVLTVAPKIKHGLPRAMSRSLHF